ncbi:MAG TPA: TraR/DksA family transcriptional regulator [Methylomirabilota bacterium]|jgi:DnaK suppressor protein
MNDTKKRLEQELRATVSRLRHVAGPDDLEDLPPSIGSIFDDSDSIQIEQAREMGLVTKARLIDRVNKIAAALGRFERGEYGLCVECAEPIRPARLRAMPEVATCVPCQEQLERGIDRRVARHDLRQAA